MTIDDIRTANKAAGGHFFDPETMRFFQSCIFDKVYKGPGGVFFITSEKMSYDSPRLYTVRHFWPNTGNITTALGDCNYRQITWDTARLAAAAAAYREA